MLNDHIQLMIDMSDDFEKKLYEKAKENSTSPAGAIKWLNKLKYDLPEKTSGTRDELIAYALAYKEFDDVIKMIREEAMNQQWPTS